MSEYVHACVWGGGGRAQEVVCLSCEVVMMSFLWE